RPRRAPFIGERGLALLVEGIEARRPRGGSLQFDTAFDLARKVQLSHHVACSSDWTGRFPRWRKRSNVRATAPARGQRERALGGLDRFPFAGGDQPVPLHLPIEVGALDLERLRGPA